MPFTLAHPAAVLPLKRYCPRFLSFSGLVAGSLAPDVGYGFQRLKLDELSHTFKGSFIFSLPVGVLMLAVMYGIRRPTVNLLPERQRQIFLPVCRRPVGPVWAVLISILLGAWTHLVWDSFTHNRGWAGQHLPWLQIPIASLGGSTLRVCHLLWYASSFVGVAALCFAYERWRQAAGLSAPAISRHPGWRNPIIVGVLVLPIEAIHHLSSGLVGFALVGGCSLLLVIGVALNVGNSQPASPQKES